MRLLLASPFGRIAVAVRENETRAALLGYDPRLIKLGVFMVGGAVAGLAGALYVNWGAFVGRRSSPWRSRPRSSSGSPSGASAP